VLRWDGFYLDKTAAGKACFDYVSNLKTSLGRYCYCP